MRTASSSGVPPLPPLGRGRQSHHSQGKVEEKKRRILIIDDNLIFLKATAFKLKSLGYEVLTAEDGASAIANVRRKKPELILLDLNFPPDVAHGGGVPWDGFMLLNWLRRMNHAANIPVIAITVGKLELYRDRCLAAGVVDIFPKPIDHAALVASMQEALNKVVPQQEQDSEPLEFTSQTDVQAAQQPESNSELTSNPGSEPPAKPPTGKRILLVDDESDWRYMGSLYLTECGYEVFTTEDAIGALVQAAAINPDLVLLDLNLAGESGATLLKLLAAAHPKVPILIYTGMELDESEVLDFINEGAFQCIRKGTMEELLAAVGKALAAASAQAGEEPKTTASQEMTLETRDESAEESLGAVEIPEGPLLPELTPESAGDQQLFEMSGEEIPEESVVAPETALDALPDEAGIPPAPTGELPEPTAESALAPQSAGDQQLFEMSGEEIPQQSVVDPETALDALPDEAGIPPVPTGELPEPTAESATESVLIVSEDAGFTDELRAFLESQSYRVMNIDGAQAVACISESPVDFILFDMAVPSPQAEQFYGAVLSTAPDQCKRIVFMTNDDVDPKSDGFVRRAKAPMLWRPFAFEDLLQTLQTMRSQFSEAV